MERSTHIPILVAPIVEAFKLSDQRRFLDGTFGGGGHSRAIKNAFPQTELWALDRDPEAIERAKHLDWIDSIHLQQDNFQNLDKLPGKFDAILLDLGVSSDQLDSAQRGFSFRFSGPLDMRMDPAIGRPASSFLERATIDELQEAIRDFGEEKYWKRIIEAILEARGTGKLQRTETFVQLLQQTLPPRRGQHIDPCTKTFQGIRIAVNGELEALDQALKNGLEKLAPGGIFAILTFHSLEDRRVKTAFRLASGLTKDRFDQRLMDERPRAIGNMITRKPIRPEKEECGKNPRARSAKLRIFQKFRNKEAKK